MYMIKLNPRVLVGDACYYFAERDTLEEIESQRLEWEADLHKKYPHVPEFEYVVYEGERIMQEHKVA